MNCMLCGNEFKKKHHLKQHLNRLIKCDNKIECMLCGKKFKTTFNLNRHNDNNKDCNRKYLETEILNLKKDNEILNLKL